MVRVYVMRPLECSIGSSEGYEPSCSGRGEPGAEIPERRSFQIASGEASRTEVALRLTGERFATWRARPHGDQRELFADQTAEMMTTSSHKGQHHRLDWQSSHSSHRSHGRRIIIAWGRRCIETSCSSQAVCLKEPAIRWRRNHHEASRLSSTVSRIRCSSSRARCSSSRAA
jgi:hypothetical protein